MSNNVHRFFRIVRNDAGLLTELETCRSEESFLRKAVSLGAGRGLCFTSDDIRIALGTRQPTAQQAYGFAAVA